jgi:hypothetical protein
MKSILLGATILAAIGANPVSAQLRLAMSVDGSIFVAADGGVSDLDPLPNAIVIGQQSLDGVSVIGTFANSSKLPSPDNNALNMSNLLITNTSSSVKTLFMAVSDNDYPGEENCIMTAVSGTWNGVGTSQAKFAFFVDGTNVDGALTSTDTPGHLIVTNNDSAGSGPLAFSFEGDNPFMHGTPFSMTEAMVFTLAPGAKFIGNSVAMEAVPEASTWLMMATGFGMLSMFGLRRKPRPDLNLS